MILVAGLTPAWQQIMSFKQFLPGEVNRAADVEWCASGKAVNCAAALAALNVPMHLLSPSGGWSGEALRTAFVAPESATWIPTHNPTRICTTILNQADSNATELVGNASALREIELNAFQLEYRTRIPNATFAILTGSLPHGASSHFYRELLEQTPCPVLLDVRGPELREALHCKPRVVKPNREELSMTVGRALPDRKDVLEAMRELLECGAGGVIVTQGKDAVWVMQGDEAWELTPPSASPVINPIGCGDCLAAGVAWGLSRGDTLVNAVRLGIAAAADNVTQLLPARLNPTRVNEYLAQVRVNLLPSSDA